MRGCWRGLAAAWVLATAGAAMAAEPPVSVGVKLATGALDPFEHDFGTDRYAPGQTPQFLADKALAEAAIAKAHGQPNLSALRATHACLTPNETMTLAGYESALLAKDAWDWAQQQAAADTAFGRFAAARDAVMAGQDAPYPEFKADAAAMARAKAATQPELATLYGHQAADGLWRHALVLAGRQTYAGEIGAAATIWLNARLTVEGCATDKAAAEWLRGALARIAWFDIKTYGKDADAAAWQIAEHADVDPVLQVAVLDRMGSLAVSGQANPANFAFLWDHVALNSGRPQRYGTQMRCVGKVFAPIAPVEEPAKLDERRGWVGLAPAAVAAQNGAKLCGG